MGLIDADAEAKYERMTTKPVQGLILSMAVPAICSMIITSLYSFADTYFVSRLGTSVQAAPGIAQPLFLIIQAVSLTFAVGAGSVVARKLGERENEEASEVVSTSFFLSIIIGMIIGCFSLIFLEPMMVLFGATPTILPSAYDYAFYVILATPFFSATFVLNFVIRGEGNAKLSVFGTVIGAVVNMILDPLFIFVFHMGIKGAAIATSISQIISFAVFFGYMMKGSCITRIKWRYFTLRPSLLKEVLKIGSPDFFRTCLSSVAGIMLNNAAGVYGDATLAGMTVVTRIVNILFGILTGFGQGYQPVCGYCYGAKLYSRVKQGLKFTMGAAFVTIGAIALGGCIFAYQIMTFFQPEDEEFIRTGSLILRTQLIVLIPATVTITANMLFQACGKALQSSVLALSRNGVFFIPMILILPGIYGLKGVIAAQPVADIITFLLSLPMLYYVLKEMTELEKKEKLVVK